MNVITDKQEKQKHLSASEGTSCSNKTGATAMG